MKNIEFMVDLETMGLAMDSAITAIGIVAFDMDKLEIVDTFYREVELESSVTYGGVMTPDTVIWWMRQEEAARKHLWSENRQPINIALLDADRWMHLTCGGEIQGLWGNGAAFDNVVLREAYDRCGYVPPWRFTKDRCYRTMKAMNPDVAYPERTKGVHHNALDDAVFQTEHLFNIIRGLRS